MTEPNNLSIDNDNDTEPESTAPELDTEPPNQAVSSNVAAENQPTPGTTSARNSLLDLQEIQKNSNSYYLAQPSGLAAISHTNSSSWEASRITEQAKFAVVMANLARTEIILRSPFVPTNFHEWLEHRVAFNEDIRSEEMGKLVKVEASHGSGARSGRVRIGPAFGGKQFHDHRSSVLAMGSIWTPWYRPTHAHPQAPWPSREAMRREGDERHTSGFGRFLALPRAPGNDTLAWHQQSMIQPFPFDKVWEVPVLQEKHDDDEPAMEALIGENLLEKIDP